MKTPWDSIYDLLSVFIEIKEQQQQGRLHGDLLVSIEMLLKDLKHKDVSSSSTTIPKIYNKNREYQNW